MFSQRPTDISKFFLAGINYRKADASVRGLFAINNEQYSRLFTLAPLHHVKEFFVVSTCNRTEIYGLAEDALTLSRLLCTQTEGSIDQFCEMAYVKKGVEAVEHFFNVAAGLDSQILGDYEIIGQIKAAVKLAKEADFINVFTERLVNSVLQSSKNIKTNTELSGGTVSVSFAAVQYIKEKVPHFTDKKIVLLGTGKIGRNTCKNLVDYLGTKNITLINRSEEKAAELARELGLKFVNVNELAEQVSSADIILVATNSDVPVILKSQVANRGDKLIIDLSVPYNVEVEVQQLPSITLINVDELSKIKDETLQHREAEVPKAKLIIAKHMAEFIEWQLMRRHVPVLKAVRTKLEQLNHFDLFISYSSKYSSSTIYKSEEERIQKVINGMAVKMKKHNRQGCSYIEAINEYIATGTS